MAARPTDRTPNSKVEKISARMSQVIEDSAFSKPVNNSVNYVARQLIFRALKHLQFGSLTLIEDFNEDAPHIQSFGVSLKASTGTSTKAPSSSKVGHHALDITLMIHHSKVYRQLLFGGSIALADSYINGEWHTDDLTRLIRLGARNLAVLNSIESRYASLSKTLERAKHQLRGNDKANAKSNILAHYDLGNAMYQRFLDPTMMYSSAVYPTADATLSTMVVR